MHRTHLEAPEEIWVALLGDGRDGAVGEHELVRAQVVDRQPEPVRLP